MIYLIVAKANNGIIGSSNDLPWYLPADLKHFKDLTSGHTVVMGRKTFESIISRLGRPLPDRKNVVVSRDTTFSYDGVEVVHDLDSIVSYGDVFVIGGAEIYRQTIDRADTLFVTEVHVDIDGDATFPVIDREQWREISREKHVSDTKNAYDYDFVTYERQ